MLLSVITVIIMLLKFPQANPLSSALRHPRPPQPHPPTLPTTALLVQLWVGPTTHRAGNHVTIVTMSP